MHLQCFRRYLLFPSFMSFSFLLFVPCLFHVCGTVCFSWGLRNIIHSTGVTVWYEKDRVVPDFNQDNWRFLLKCSSITQPGGDRLRCLICAILRFILPLLYDEEVTVFFYRQFSFRVHFFLKFAIFWFFKLLIFQVFIPYNFSKKKQAALFWWSATEGDVYWSGWLRFVACFLWQWTWSTLLTFWFCDRPTSTLVGGCLSINQTTLSASVSVSAFSCLGAAVRHPSRSMSQVLCRALVYCFHQFYNILVRYGLRVVRQSHLGPWAVVCTVLCFSSKPVLNGIIAGGAAHREMTFPSPPFPAPYSRTSRPNIFCFASCRNLLVCAPCRNPNVSEFLLNAPKKPWWERDGSMDCLPSRILFVCTIKGFWNFPVRPLKKPNRVRILQSSTKSQRGWSLCTDSCLLDW